MASERDQALREFVKQSDPQSTKLEAVISEATSEAEHTKRLELAHKHEMNKLRAELGWFGYVFGSATHAPLVIAFIVVACGMVASGALWWLAYATGMREFWSGEAHIALGAATTALGYVFGRGSKNDSK